MCRKLSVVETSTSMREGRSARAHTMPESVDTSPDCKPWVICGRSPAKLRLGLATPSMTVAAAAAPADDRKLRRDGVAPTDMRIAIGPPQADSRATMPAPGDSAPTLMRQRDDSAPTRHL